MLLDSMFTEIKKIMLGLDIKYRSKGEDNDTAEARYAADRYMNAYKKLDSFISYDTFDMDAVKRSGLATDDLVAIEYALNPNTIPNEYRDAVLEQQRGIILTTYEDLNDYYRVLSGLPGFEDPELYADGYFYEEQGIEFKPVHEFNDVEMLQLISYGELDKMKTMFSNVDYLNYLGPNRIDPFVARSADNFQIIRTTYKGDSELLDKFVSMYDKNREYVMNVLYVREFSATKPYYDNFMALVTLIMTVQRTIIDVFKSGVTMDFFDAGLIKMVFESYNVPFIEDLSLDYQKLLVRNLNKLLYYKSTDKVLYDICEILGFSDSSIYKYYLVKNHRLDEDGKPIFAYKKDENGDTVEDLEAMYEIYFQAVDIKEENEEFALQDNTNRATYESVVAEDPYWTDDDGELKKKLYESEFNYIDTKYLHMNVMYKLTEMMFEIVHIYRILQDKKNNTTKVDISLPKVLPSRNVSLFTYTVFMCAAIAKKNKLTGEIITSPSQTLHIFGFDFGADLTTIKESLSKKPKHINYNKIAGLIYNTEITSSTDVELIYNNVRELWEFLVLSLKNAKTIEEYRAYERLYKALHVTQDMSEVFTKSDGTVAETYLDMLYDLDFELYDMVNDASEPELFDYINNGIDSAKELVDGLKYLNGLTDSSDFLLNALAKLVRFFKSYTVDLREFNILYVLDNRYLHAIKILEKIQEVESVIDRLPDAKILDVLTNDLMYVISSMHSKEYNRVRDFLVSREMDMTTIERLIDKLRDTMDVESSMFDKHYDSIKDIRLHSNEVQFYYDLRVKLIRLLLSNEVDIDKRHKLLGELSIEMESSFKASTNIDLLDIVSEEGSMVSHEDHKMKDQLILLRELEN